MIPRAPIIIPRRVIPSDAVVKRTIDVAERLTTLTEWHQEYLSGQRIPQLPPADEVRKELEAIIDDPAFGYDQRVAEAASFISAALVGERPDAQDAERLPYLGKAIVLAIESERGRTNEVAFQDVVRYLLAKNGYTPMRTSEYGEHFRYHFYTDQPGKKVVAISENDVKLYCAELKSAFGLDELIEDFLNLKNGKSQELAIYELRRRTNSLLIPMWVGTAGLFGGFMLPVFSGMAPEYIGISGCFGLSFVSAYTGYKAAKFTHAKISEHRYQHKLQQEQATFPQQTLTSGVYALIDAFPLEKNLLVEEK